MNLSRPAAMVKRNRNPRTDRFEVIGSPKTMAVGLTEFRGASSGYTGQAMETPGKDDSGKNRAPGLYFFPNDDVTEEEVREILREGGVEERAWVVSHLLRYAQWDDLWGYVTRDEVREIFPHLDLPENLRQAWARMLKIEAPVS